MRVFVFIILEEDHIVATFLHSCDFEAVHDTEIVEDLIKSLPFVEASDIVYAGIQRVSLTPECLQAAADLFILFEYTDFEALLAYYGSTEQATKACANYHDIIWSGLVHTIYA